MRNLVFLFIICLWVICIIFFWQDIYKSWADFYKNGTVDLQQNSDGSDCELVFLSWWVMVDPRCIAEKPPHLREHFQETIDNRWEDVIGFTHEYQHHTWEFLYTGSLPIFSGKLQEFAISLDILSWRQDLLEYSWSKVILTYAQYDVWRMMYFSYAVTRRDKLDLLWPCARINYDVAMIVIDRQYLLPDQELNLNKQLAHRIGYCGTPESFENYSFQWGVCGAASQLFRTALISPDLSVVEREPHRIWYELYYDDIIRGDDAAVIEFRKQLRINNTGQYPLYFRTKNPDRAESSFVVAISPYQDDRQVRIKRWQVSEMQWVVSTTTTSASGEILYQTGWTSQYVTREPGKIN